MRSIHSLRRQYWGKQATVWAEEDFIGMPGQVRAETIQRYLEESQKK